jgi:predicted tellurium resistance membrane protein TerC
MDNILVLLSDPAAWGALGALIAMEVVLGIDNLIFISILTNKLPEHQRERARMIGISAALVLRLGLLSLVFVIVQLIEPVITILGQDFSWRDLILISGGLFLVWKATKRSITTSILTQARICSAASPRSATWPSSARSWCSTSSSLLIA